MKSLAEGHTAVSGRARIPFWTLCDSIIHALPPGAFAARILKVYRTGVWGWSSRAIHTAATTALYEALAWAETTMEAPPDF